MEQYNKVAETFTSISGDKYKGNIYYEEICIILAESFYQLKDYKRSDSLFRFIIEEYPENYIAKNNFGYYLALRNESLNEAKEISYSTVQKFPDNSTYLDTYAWILFKLEDFKEAEKYIMQALKYGGINDADILEHAADIQMALKNYENAQQLYEQAINRGGSKQKIQDKLERIQGMEME